MSTPVTQRVVLIGDSSTAAAREQIAALLSAATIAVADAPTKIFVRGAVARPFFASAREFVGTVAEVPSVIVAVESAPTNGGAAATATTHYKNAHAFRYWWTEGDTTAADAAAAIQAALADPERLHPRFTSSRSSGNTNNAANATTATTATPSVSFLRAIRDGLAPDGGLYTPTRVPRLAPSQLRAICGFHARYADFALAALEQLVDVAEVPPGVLAEMVDAAYRADAWATALAPRDGQDAHDTLPVRCEPIVGAGDNIFMAELFHGPTAAFKDFALQLFPRLVAQSILDGGDDGAACDDGDDAEAAAPSRFMILAATSGDTGVAAIRGFMSGAPDVKVMVLYPRRGVSPVQREQMLACHGGNVHVVGVDGDFDFCQSSVKAIFGDRGLNARLASECRTQLSSSNSINWGRLLPQVIYYAWMYAQLLRQQHAAGAGAATPPLACFDVVVPTGNFGNILSGYFAKLLGVPIRRFVLASNVNDVLCDFVNTGVYDIAARSLAVTASPSIDILKASNVERFLYLVSGYDGALVASLMRQLDAERRFEAPASVRAVLRADFVAYRCTEAECAEEIQLAARRHVVLDPHTAVAARAARLYRAAGAAAAGGDDAGVPLVIVSTAQWAKFPDSVLHAIEHGTFPADAGTSNALAAEAVPAIFAAVCAKVPGAFVAEPLRRTFERFAEQSQQQHAPAVTCDKSLAQITEHLLSFAARE